MFNTPKEVSEALLSTGGEVEVTESLYFHYMEVLPPRRMGPGFFVFQEGDGERLYLYQCGNRFYCYLLSDYLVTEDWKIQCGVSRQKKSEPFKVNFIFLNDGTDDLPDEYQEFIGQPWQTISALADAMSVSFRV